MILLNENFQKLDTSLRDFEVTLRSLYEKYPERHLEEPHELEEIEDVLKEATQLCPNGFADKLLEHRLEEDLYFSHNADVEIYHHIRYLPPSWHSQSFIEIACVLQGSCTHYIMGQCFTLEEGDICIIAPDTVHAVSVFSDDCMLFNFIVRTSTFEEAFFGVLSENDILSDFFMRSLYHRSAHPYLLFRAGDDEELFGYVGAALQEFGHNHLYKDRMLRAILNVFFITLLRSHGTDVIFPESSSPQENENTILILKYIQEHYNTLTLTELASFFNYSERQIQRIVKDCTGMSFSQNIQHLKLRQAVRLMQNPNLSIAEISEELGYSAPENFRHVFKKYYGMTPMEYRSAHNSEDIL